MSGFTRAMARLYLAGAKRRAQPIGGSVAIFTHDHIGTKILLDGAFALPELEALAAFVFPKVAKGAVFLDVGANIGNHARFFARHAPHVFAFEPHPRTQLLLRANGMGQNITVLGYGLSDQGADLPAQTNLANMGGSKVARDGGDGTTFRVERLDDVIGGLTDAPIGFVKFDVEDHEPEAIAGAAETLRKHRPVIAMEVNPNTVVDGRNAAHAALRALGYDHFYHIENVAGWTRIKPKALRTLVRSLLRIVAPSAIYKSELARVEALRPQGYPLLIAACGPL